MTGRSVACARWCSHVNAVNPPRTMRDWLTDTGSLTQKLMRRCTGFRIRRLRQQCGMCLADEYAHAGLPRRCRVREREVLLQCGERAAVFAHTIMPLRANASDWPVFGRLGERSLGSILFGDPHVMRGTMQYARLSPCHPLVRRASAALGKAALAGPLYARRCLYRRKRGVLLVTEVFLPAIAEQGEQRQPAHSRIKESNKQRIE